MTPRDKVLAVHPKAKVHGFAGKRFMSFHVVSEGATLGIGDTVRGAWRAAAAAVRKAVGRRS